MSIHSHIPVSKLTTGRTKSLDRVSTFAFKSLKRVVISGTRAVTAETMLLESVVLNADEAVVSLVAVVIAVFRLSTLMTSASDWNREPVYEVASLVRVAISEEMLAKSLRTVLASRGERGSAATVEERTRTRALVSCILLNFEKSGIESCRKADCEETVVVVVGKCDETSEDMTCSYSFQTP
jgi:hypothetical protein